MGALKLKTFRRKFGLQGNKIISQHFIYSRMRENHTAAFAFQTPVGHCTKPTQACRCNREGKYTVSCTARRRIISSGLLWLFLGLRFFRLCFDCNFDVLELDELKKLLAELENPARALVFLTAATGLTVSEALGLKWSDVDFAAGEIRLSRAVVHQHVGDMKTEASQKPVPMDGALLDALQDWSRQAPYRQTGDWVFASPDMDGKQPYWPETPLRCYVQPAAKRVGITKALGWHSSSAERSQRS
jgi:integrase